MKQPVIEATGGTAVRVEGATKAAGDIAVPHDRVAEATNKRAELHASESESTTGAPRADVHAQSFRGALMQDHWLDADDPEHSTIPTRYIAELSRASDAITTIARLVHNSICEPRMSGAEPLGFAAHTGLLDALEIIGTHLGDVAESMRQRARDVEMLRSMQEDNHD